MKKSIPPYVHCFPAPAVLIGCGSLENPNLITCSWFGVVCSNPPMVSVSIRPSRHSHALVRDLQEFTVNIPRASDLEIVKYCGTKSGRDVNKFEALGLTPAPAPPLTYAPMAVEFPISLACRVKQTLELGSHHCFIAEVVAIHADENLIRPTNRADPFGTEQLVYLDGKYWTLNLIGQA